MSDFKFVEDGKTVPVYDLKRNVIAIIEAKDCGNLRRSFIEPFFNVIYIGEDTFVFHAPISNGYDYPNIGSFVQVKSKKFSSIINGKLIA